MGYLSNVCNVAGPRHVTDKRLQSYYARHVRAYVSYCCKVHHQVRSSMWSYN